MATIESGIVSMLMVNRMVLNFCVVLGDGGFIGLYRLPLRIATSSTVTNTPWWGFYFSKTDYSPQNEFKIFLIVPEKRGGTND